MSFDPDRFVEAQDRIFEQVHRELRYGRKHITGYGLCFRN